MFKFIEFLTTREGKLWAKGDQEDTRSAIKQQRVRSQGQATSYQDRLKQNIGNESSIDPQTGISTPGSGRMGRIQTQRDALNKRFSDYASTGGISENTRNALQDSPDSIAGRIKAPDYSGALSGYQNFAGTGGIDLSQPLSTFKNLQGTNMGMQNDANSLRNIDFSGIDKSIKDLGNVDYSNVQGSIGKLNEFGATGGMSEQDKSNILRPLYYENEKTGGYSDKQLADIKAESNSSIPGFYSSMQDEMDRRRASSGYGPGFGAAAQSAARQGAVAAGDQALRTNVGLAESVRQGKTNAADALQRGQLGISGITTPARQAALSEAGRLGMGMAGQQSQNIATGGQLGLGKTGQQASNLEGSSRIQQSIAQIRQAAAQGDVDAQRLIQSGKLAGLGGMTDIAGAQGQFELNRGNLASGNVRGLAGMEQQGQQYGMSGLGGMYNSEMNQLSDEQRNQLTAMGLDANTQNQLLSLLSGNAQQPGKWAQGFGNLLGGFGSVAGGISGLR